MNPFFERIQNLSQKRLVLLAMELQNRLAALESQPGAAGRDHGSIAVIGMACRIPGGANSPEAFWQLLQEGRDAISEIPADRWNADAYYDPDVKAEGKMATRWGGFISGIQEFDPALFGITPREAITMDPQQRILLEVCWEALERAGYAPDRLMGDPTGVFVGACNSDYAQMLSTAELDTVDMYMTTGAAHSVLSGRVSYVFGLQGPAITIDTACSSSLAALNYAVQSLRAGECRMALAGGVNAILTPDVTVTLSQSNMMASDGRCKAFSAAADGFVRSEGCGMLVLKRVVDAVADGDPILAVIRGTAINQDGRSNGLTAPNGPSQVAVIQAALQDAGLTAADVTYVETHGTGTSLGDPIEAQALGAALGPGHSAQNPLMIGSVKTNLGHLESAAGAAGMIKLVLSLMHGEIPPHLHLKEVSPHIPWAELPLTIPTVRTPWSGRRIGGVSSFGLSGTNVHMILEAYTPVSELESPAAPETHPAVLTISAKSENSLAELAGRYERFLKGKPAGAWLDIAYSANHTRARLPYRMAVVAGSPQQASQKLATWLADPQTDAVLRSQAPVNRAAEVTFLFTGHGAQYAGMGKQLFESQPVFRQAIEHCAELARAYLPGSLLEALYPQDDNGLIDTMTYGQPAIFAIQVALVELWRSWGIRPASVAGHSLGEYAAAVTAGILSLEDGLKVVCARGRLMDSLQEKGGMASVFAAQDQVAEVIRPFAKDLSIAVINHPTNIVISGAQTALEAALAAFEEQGIKTRRLAVAQAAHSPLLDAIQEEFTSVVSTVQFSAPRIDLISCTTGLPVSPAEISQAGYWWRHLRNPVQFVRVMETLQERRQSVFLEIGPHPVVISNAQRLLPAGFGTWAASLREKFDDVQQILQALGRLFTAGVDADWQSFYRHANPGKVLLPTYPFDSQKYWIKPATARGVKSIHREPGISPLLERRLSSPALEQAVFEGHISTTSPAYLDHHRIFGTSITPSPAFIEMAVRAAEELFGPGPKQVSNLTIQEAMILPDEGEKTVQVILTPSGEDSASFRIVSFDGKEQWKTHATGTVARYGPAPDPAAPVAFQAEIESIQARCPEQVSGPDYYAMVAGLGLEFGESFRGLEQIWRRDGEALGRIAAPQIIEHEIQEYRFHPALLDACLHLVGAPLPGAQVDSAYLLIGIDHFRLYRQPTGPLWNHTVLGQHAGETFTGSIRLYSEAGELVAEAEGLQLKRANRSLLLRSVRPQFSDWFYQVAWQAQSLGEQAARAGEWCIVPDKQGFARLVVERLAAQGAPARVLSPGEKAPDGSRVVYLPGLDASLNSPPDDLLDEQAGLTYNAIQALVSGSPARFWVVTHGAQPVLSESVQPAQAALWGLGRVMGLEYPDTWGGLIDLDPAQTLADQVDALLAELNSGGIEDQVAYREGGRRVARLVRTNRSGGQPYTFSPNAAYWITGGLGGLGLATARWLAEHGTRMLLLSGRHGLPERSEWDSLPAGSQAADQAAAVLEIERSYNTRVEVVALDISDRQAVQRLLKSFGSTRPQLKGILHMAAVLGGRTLAEMDITDLRAMFQPKIGGSVNLVELTREMDLDFLALFSSSTALWGSSQLGHYAAANAFMDSLAHQARKNDQPVISINWGTWEVMRAASQTEQERTVQFGLEQMPVEAALGILGSLLPPTTAQIAVANVDWSALKPAYEARRERPFLKEVSTKKGFRPAAAAVPAREVSLAERLQAVKPEERSVFLIEHVRQQVARVISAPDPSRLNITQGLFEMGLDSLMSVELKSLLETSVGQPLPSTLTFNYPTIADLARYLEDCILQSQAVVQPGEVAVVLETGPAQKFVDPLEQDLDTLSEDELASLLASKLSRLD